MEWWMLIPGGLVAHSLTFGIWFLLDHSSENMRLGGDAEPCTGESDCACDVCFNPDSFPMELEDDEEDDEDEEEDDEEEMCTGLDDCECEECSNPNIYLDEGEDELVEDSESFGLDHHFMVAPGNSGGPYKPRADRGKNSLEDKSLDYQAEVRKYLREITFNQEALPKTTIAKLEVTIPIGGMPDGDSGKMIRSDSEKTALPNVAVLKLESAIIYRREQWRNLLRKLREDFIDKFRSEGMDCYEGKQGAAGKLGTDLANGLLEGSRVNFYVLENLDHRDKHERLLVVITISMVIDGKTYEIDYQGLAIRTGAAVFYKGTAAVRDSWYEKLYGPLEEAARREKLGAHGLTPVPESPEIWRRKDREGESHRAAMTNTLQKFFGIHSAVNR